MSWGNYWNHHQKHLVFILPYHSIFCLAPRARKNRSKIKRRSPAICRCSSLAPSGAASHSRSSANSSWWPGGPGVVLSHGGSPNGCFIMDNLSVNGWFRANYAYFRRTPNDQMGYGRIGENKTHRYHHKCPTISGFDEKIFWGQPQIKWIAGIHLGAKHAQLITLKRHSIWECFALMFEARNPTCWGMWH